MFENMPLKFGVNWSSEEKDMSQPRWTKVAKIVQAEWLPGYPLCGTI